jgi:N-acyl-D-aspartate/D-glutamate deacylase
MDANMYDIVIKNGTVVDGDGAPGYRGDLAVSQGMIVEIGEVSGAARRTIDADGLVVAPGFIDPHTHYDAQVCWDPLVTPSSWHGVTTVVMGNCGVGIAPCKPDALSREIATRDLVTVEQIDYEVLSAGISWDWSTFPEYMQAAQRRGCGVNMGFIAPLTPFRHFVMGEESLHRAANPSETAEIKALLKDAVTAGALGFSTTFMANHLGYKGLPLAAQNASREELKAYCNALKELGKGMVEAALAPGSMVGETELELLDLFVNESGRPVTWLSLLDRDSQPEVCISALEATDKYAKRGAMAQVSTRPLMVTIDMLEGGNTDGVFHDMASWEMVRGRSGEARKAVFKDPAFRAAFRNDLKTPHLFSGRWEGAAVHRATSPAMKSLAGQWLPDIAARRGQDVVDTFFDLAVEDDLGLTYSFELLNTQEDRVAALITDPRNMIGLADGGAHLDMLCDAGYCTYLLGHWVRDKQALSLEYAVKRLTSEIADFFGIAGRGRLAKGAAADIVLFDPARVGSARRPNSSVRDLPGGGERMLMPAQGVEHTIVNGTVLFEDGKHTGWLPGRVVAPA